MRIADQLKIIASGLENEDNQALLLSQDNEEATEIVATALVRAAEILKEAADAIEVRDLDTSLITADSLEEMAALAEAFDASEDELLQKQASVLDEIHMTIGAPKGGVNKYSEVENNRIAELKKLYLDKQDKSREHSMEAEAIEAIKKSPYTKEYRALEAPLQTRYCPDHPGTSIARIAEHQYQCGLDGKVFDFEVGFKTEKGNVVPGTSISNQSQNLYSEQHNEFDTRESRLGNYYQK